MAWKDMNRISAICQPTPKQVFVAGGFSRNPAFLALRASLEEISENPLNIYTVEDKDVGCRGAAMCGACAVGAFSSLPEASESMAALSYRIYGSASVGRKLLAIKSQS
jgi:sugar (pentulose or hexulose) kinase